MSSIGEFACTYACLILHDDDIPINIIIDELIMNVRTPTSNNNVATPPSITDNDASTAPSVNNKKKEEIKEESDDEAMFSLFD
ncbi:uncharacterized protein LOC125839704 [Solanum verrucosum]|uniref:uncharacterized protein LOC125839704 n=1 Tax=Solanum verrucosum TaxID=315347 RepID=UPI0020D1EDD0|nr:uncharacterized protein LOC125839704 [Solanum verrucosum]